MKDLRNIKYSTIHEVNPISVQSIRRSMEPLLRSVHTLGTDALPDAVRPPSVESSRSPQLNHLGALS